MAPSSSAQVSSSSSYVPGTWDLPDQPYRRSVTIKNSTAEELLDFPVPVRIAPPASEFLTSRPDGLDVVFFLDGAMLSRDVDAWTSTQGLMWVRVPRLPGNGAVTLSMYSGSPGAYPSDPATWDAATVAEFHMGTPEDSTVNRHQAQLISTSQVLGTLQDTVKFGAADSEMLVADNPVLNNIFERGGGTVSAWIFARTSGSNGYARIVDKAAANFNAPGYAFGLNGNSNNLTLFLTQGRSGTDLMMGSSGNLSASAWHHVSLRFDSVVGRNSVRFTVDGQPTSSQVLTPGNGSATPDDASRLRIGNSQNGNRAFDGQISDVRLSTVLRSDAWLRMEHDVVTDMALVMLGPQELRP